MNSAIGIAVVSLVALSSCTQTEGQCWHDDQGMGSVGAGGAPIVPGGGGNGDVAPSPQDATNPVPPDCEIVPDSYCAQKCLTDYENAAANCGMISDSALRRSCQDAAYAAYKGCKERCLTAEGKWEDKCYDDYEADHKKCDKMKDGPEKAKCRQAAGERLGNCNAECNKKK